MRSLGWIACLLLLTPLLMADADRQDWIGEYAMNHDGHPGTLRILQGRCRRGLPCTELAIRYADERGTEYAGSVLALDDSGQHLRFSIAFPGNAQIFDVYIFSFDKTKLAGTTVWGGRTFGVMAQKRMARMAASEIAASAALAGRVPTHEMGGAPTRRPEPTGTPTRTMLADGSIALTYPDGTVKTKRVGHCGWNTRYPDGHTQGDMCTMMQSMPLVPPTPPDGSPEELWLRAQDSNLLEIIQKVLGGINSPDYQNYLRNYENPPDPVLFKRIFHRTQAIADLTSIPE